MAYSTVAQVRDALTPGGVSNDRTTAAGLTDGQILDAIAEADSVINIYISMRYITPITADPIPDTVEFWSRSLASYLITLTRARSKDLKDDDPVVRRQRLVMSQLKMIQSGDAQIDLPLLPPDSSQEAVVVQNLYEGDLFLPADYSLYPHPIGQDAQGRWPDVNPFRGL